MLGEPGRGRGAQGRGRAGSQTYRPEESGDAADRGRAGFPGLRARRTTAFTRGPRRRCRRVLAEWHRLRASSHVVPKLRNPANAACVCHLLLGRPRGCLCCGFLERSTLRAGVCLERPQLLTHDGVVTFCSHHSACRILVPQAGTEPSGQWTVRSPNHWTPRKSLGHLCEAVETPHLLGVQRAPHATQLPFINSPGWWLLGPRPRLRRASEEEEDPQRSSAPSMRGDSGPLGKGEGLPQGPETRLVAL